MLLLAFCNYIFVPENRAAFYEAALFSDSYSANFSARSVWVLLCMELFLGNVVVMNGGAI